MGAINTIITLVIIVFGILQIILFFKIWGMTNDVSQIRAIIEQLSTRNNSVNGDASDATLKAGDLVVRKETEDQLRISSINTDGSYSCTKGGIHIGTLNREDFFTWEEWLKHLKSNK